MYYLPYIGLSLICLGWLVQLVRSFKHKKEISRGFVTIYAIGVLFLVYDGFNVAISTLSLLNLGSLILALLVLWKNVRKPVR